MHYLGIILGVIFGYFIGSVSWSIIVVWAIKRIDVRKTGSMNAGATNTMRTIGMTGAFFVVWLDALKVVVVAFITYAFSLIDHPLFSETSYFIPALAVIIGHCFPVYFKFKGGKGVACFLGLLFISNIFYLLAFLIIWFIVVYFSRIVSTASIVAAIFVGLLLIWLPWVSGTEIFTWKWNSYQEWFGTWENVWLRFSWMNYLHVIAAKSSHYYFADSLLEINIVIVLSMIILAWRHSANIKRLSKKTEPRTFRKRRPWSKKINYVK